MREIYINHPCNMCRATQQNTPCDTCLTGINQQIKEMKKKISDLEAKFGLKEHKDMLK